MRLKMILKKRKNCSTTLPTYDKILMIRTKCDVAKKKKKENKIYKIAPSGVKIFQLRLQITRM